MSRSIEEYYNIYNKYLNDVLSGEQVACEYVKQVAKRQLNDLDRSINDPNFNYIFDKRKAWRYLNFVENLVHTKGKFAGKNLLIEPWQVFKDSILFGWIHKNTGLRRFRTSYTEVARKNGKSTDCAAKGLYMLSGDEEFGSVVVSAATSQKQAREVFDAAREMVEMIPEMKEELGVNSLRHSIVQVKSNSNFKPVSADKGGSLDGLNPHCAIIDELHAHKNDRTWNALSGAFGARTQPLLLAITTAGFNRNGICYTQRSYAEKVLSGVIKDDSFFAIIYTIDKTDDWTDPKCWIKANPNLGVSINIDDLKQECQKAQDVASLQNNFLTKKLNVWVNADTSWMNMEMWDKCTDENLNIEDFKDDTCIMSADLASKNDFASVVKLFVRKEKDDKDHFYCFADHYINENAAENNPMSSEIFGWEKDEWLYINPGSVTEFSKIEENITDDFREYSKLKEVCFDPYQASQIQQNLSKCGITCIEYTNNLKNMSEPTKEFEALVMSQRFHHTGDPVLKWMVSNCVAHLDAKETIFLKKDKNMPHNKIDGAIATVMCIGRYLAEKPPEPEYKVYVF